MAFTRKFLTAMGIEAEKIDEIMSAHVEVTDGLKAEINSSKADSDKLAKVQAELEQTKNSLKEANDRIAAAEKDDYKGKYESEKAAHDRLKSDVANKETYAKKEKATLDWLINSEKYSEKGAKKIIKYNREIVEQVELDNNGKATNLDKFKPDIESEWSEYKPVSETHGANTANPPANSGGRKTMTKDEIMSIKNTAERQKAIAENPEVFGLT